MDIGFLKKQIKSKELEKFYIFTGEEYKVQEIYINKISEVLGKPIDRIGSISSLYNRGKSLFSKPKLYVCRDGKEFIKTEKAWDKIYDALKDDTLIFIYTEVDKRTKFYKKWEEKIVTFSQLNQDSLYKYVHRELPKLNKSNTEYLIYACEYNYGRALIEASKIHTYVDATNKDYNNAFEDMLNSGAIYVPPHDAIFNFVDAVLMRNPRDTYDLLEECNKLEEPALRLLSVIYTSFRRVLIVQSCTSNNVQESTGLSWWDIKCTNGKTNKWRNGEIVRILNLIRFLERSVKLGTMDDNYVIDYLLVNIF